MISKQSLIAYGELKAKITERTISREYADGRAAGFIECLNIMWPLVEALEFYSKIEVWGTDMPNTRTAIDPCDQEEVKLGEHCSIATDVRGGKRARQALSDLEKRIGAE